MSLTRTKRVGYFMQDCVDNFLTRVNVDVMTIQQDALISIHALAKKRQGNVRSNPDSPIF
jgi:hypothetical protein